MNKITNKHKNLILMSACLRNCMGASMSMEEAKMVSRILSADSNAR